MKRTIFALLLMFVVTQVSFNLSANKPPGLNHNIGFDVGYYSYDNNMVGEVNLPVSVSIAQEVCASYTEINKTINCKSVMTTEARNDKTLILNKVTSLKSPKRCFEFNIKKPINDNNGFVCKLSVKNNSCGGLPY